MKLKKREEIKNEYWMKFLKSGRIEDYIMFNKYNKEDDVEFAEFGVTYDHDKQEENRRDSYQTD